MGIGGVSACKLILENMKKLLFVVFVFVSVIARGAVSEVEITGLRATPFFPKVEEGESLKQLVQISVNTASQDLPVQVRISVEGFEPYYENLDTLAIGASTIDVHVLDVQKPSSLRIELLDVKQDVLAAREMIWQPQKKWKVYYNAVSHQDLGFISYYQNLRRANREAGIDMALELCKETDTWADDDQFRWNVETSEPLLPWMMKQTPERVDELKRRILEGRIEIAAIHNTISSQMAGYEVLARSFYTPNRYVIDMLEIDPAKVAIINDVTGITRSWPLFSKEAQIPYLMHGSNYPNCLNDLYDLPVFYWNSPDGDEDNKILCRTDSYYSPNKVKTWDRTGVSALIERHVNLDWEYDCILAYDSHDFANPTLDNAKNIKAWNEKYAYPKIRCSVLSAFFDDVSRQIVPGKVHESSKDAPDSWDDQDGTDAALLAKARRVNFEIPGTEKFASIAMSLSGGYPEKEIFQAFNRTVQYHEHTNGAIDGGNHQYYETERLMHQTLIDEAIAYNQKALDGSLGKIGQQIKTKTNSIVIYNSLSWERNAMVYLEADEVPCKSFTIFDPESKKTVDVQKLENGAIAFYAEDIPSLGYRTYGIKETKESVPDPAGASEVGYLENDFYKLTIDPEKNIISELFDRELGKQLLDKASPYALGEYIHYDDLNKEWKDTRFTDVKVYRGKLLDEIHLSQEAYSTSEVKLIVYLHHKMKQIDFRLEVDKLSNGERLIGGWNRSVREAMFCAIPVEIPDFEHHHELAGAVTQPGNKDLQFEASESAYYAIQHFADASNDEYGVSLSTIECPLVEYGHPRPGYWNSAARKPQEDIVKPENSRMFLYLMNNFFSTNIRVDQPGNKAFSFSIHSHHGNWQKGQAYKFAWESSHPLISRFIPKNKQGVLAGKDSFLSVNKENVICSALKKAESNGSGFILRFFELEGKNTTVKIKVDLDGKIDRAYAVSLIENNLNELAVNEDNEIEFEINGHGLKTIRVVSSPSLSGSAQGLEGVPVSDAEISLAWDWDASDEISHFNIYRSSDPDCTPNRRNFIGTSEVSSYHDKTSLNPGGWPSNRLDENTGYFYRVAPVDCFNNEGRVSEVVKCTSLSRKLADAPPIKVKGVYTVHVSPLAPENYINIWFYTNFEKDVDKYMIHRGEKAGFIPGPSNLINEHIPSEHSIDFNGSYSASELNRQMYADKTAEENKAYFYKVCAVDAKGQKGDYSDPAPAIMNVVPLSISQMKSDNRDFATFSGEASLKIESSVPGCEIFYSLDEALPTRESEKYTGEIEMKKSGIIYLALYMPGDEQPLFRYSQFEKISQSMSQSSYGRQYQGDMAIDGVYATGSQWVSKPYGGGEKSDPRDVWLGVNLPAETEISGVVIAGDDRDMMPVQKNFRIFVRQNESLLEVENALIRQDSAIKNCYEVGFMESHLADGIMIWFDGDDLPKSELPDQDGLVRICELMLLTPDGERTYIKP